MKLVVPTDFEILEAMSDKQRQTAPNLAKILDRQRQYMNDRLSYLAGLGLVSRVGPSERSGMYKITSKGLWALQHQEEYEHSTADDFSKLIEAGMEVDSNPEYQRVLSSLIEQDSEDLSELVDQTDLNREKLQTILQSLESRGLVEKVNTERFRITSRGEKVLQSISEFSSKIQGLS